tara:strand:+ start:18 stop:269 length:252 start_codon:yes stop_codon:yes gene_type:complete
VSKKKSYMNHLNLITEGFFEKLLKIIKDKKLVNKLKKDKVITKNLKSLNQINKDTEDRINKDLIALGKKPNFKLSRFSIKDFI